MKSTLRDKPDCPAPTRRLPCLVVDDGQEKGRIISIGRASLTLGRDKNSGICIEARGVSRRHARFRPLPPPDRTASAAPFRGIRTPAAQSSVARNSLSA